MILSGLELTLMVAHGVQMVFLRWNLSVECAAAFVLFFLVLRFNKALDVIVVEGLSTGWKFNCPTNSPSQTWAGIRLLVFSCFVMFCPCDVLLLAFGCFRVFFNFCSIEDLGPFETLLFVTTDKAIRVLQLDH